jgi:hypothetical protein
MARATYRRGERDSRERDRMRCRTRKKFRPGVVPRAAALLCGVGVQPFFFFAFFFAAFFFAAISDSF